MVASAYGLGCILAPSKFLAVYGATEAIPFFTPAHAVCQYLGGIQCVIALRCLSALGLTGGTLSMRDPKKTLEDQCLLHAAMALVAGYRTVRAAQISWLAATASPLPGAILLSYFSYAAARSLA